MSQVFLHPRSECSAGFADVGFFALRAVDFVDNVALLFAGNAVFKSALKGP